VWSVLGGVCFRLVYALAAGLATAVVCFVVRWNMGFGAGVQNSLDEETKEKVAATNEFPGDPALCRETEAQGVLPVARSDSSELSVRLRGGRGRAVKHETSQQPVLLIHK